MDAKTLDRFGADLEAVARHFGDRQNEDSTLTAREATKIVTACLNAANTLRRLAKDMDVNPPPPAPRAENSEGI